ncbi:hypothetical protein BVRB_9g220440 [Beta vulgaris subsp. vulgaris]|nr:hypothetical protein BVRB_9g220440 [Beta vulgaris subsp. vulgaris]
MARKIDGKSKGGWGNRREIRRVVRGTGEIDGERVGERQLRGGVGEQRWREGDGRGGGATVKGRGGAAAVKGKGRSGGVTVEGRSGGLGWGGGEREGVGAAMVLGLGFLSSFQLLQSSSLLLV